jgi:hypothetical protein
VSEEATVFDLPALPASDSPNADIDKAISALMKQVKAKGENSLPPETAVKVINAAINWEKVKHGIKDKDADFDPDA